MFRNDILWLLPALLLALIQVKLIWPSQPEFDEADTEIKGTNTEYDILFLIYLQYIAYLLFIMQLFVPIFLISRNFAIIFVLRIIGYLLTTAGFVISLLALKTLGNNWTGMTDYRIKKGQSLIQNGVYKMIRHPIYCALILEIMGFEFIANSWLVIILTLGSLIIMNKQANKEEELLTKKFGIEYQEYKSRTKKIIPFLY